MPESSHKLFDHTSQCPTFSGLEAEEGARGFYRADLRNTLQRYSKLALVTAIVVGIGLMLLGHAALGKGLILGTLFSIFNFILTGIALPMRLGKNRGKSVLYSLVSIVLRYAILAVPLVLALKLDTIAVPTAAIGLFAVQLAIVGDHLLGKWRKPLGAG